MEIGMISNTQEQVERSKKVLEFETKDGRKATIRFLRFEDWPELLKHINSLVKEDALILEIREKTKEEELDWVAEQCKEMELGKRLILICEVENKFAGVCDVRKFKGRKSRVGSLGIGVNKEFRGIGVGENLLKVAIRLAKEKLKSKILTLEVVENNRVAISLYKKFNFKEYGRLPKAIEYKGKFYDEILMYRRL